MINKITLSKTLLTPAFMLGTRSQKNYMGFIPRKLVDWTKAQQCLLKTPDMNVGVIDECCSMVINFNYVSKKFD